MIRNLFLISLLFFTAACQSQPPQTQKPNVIFILVDDMGWSDLSCYGSQYYETPHIDKLCSEGIKFTNAYAAAAICSPTRASCLTGRYPARIGITDWIRARFQGGKIPADKKNPSGYTLNKKHNMMVARNPLWMEHKEVTIAEMLKPLGYSTGFIGKWHLGSDEWYPETQGFDINIGGCDLGQPPSYFSPYTNTRKGKLYNIPNLKPGKKGEYLTDREGDEAVKFIQNHKDKPFFLYLCNYAVHTPIEAQEHLIKKYEKKQKTEHNHPAYAAMTEAVDNTVGKITKALQKEGLDENTLIIFTSDNGGYLKYTSNAPLKSGKGFPYEGGIREPFIVKWPGKIKAGSVSSTPISSIDILPTIAEATGAKLPSVDIDGVSLLPVLNENKKLGPRPLIWHFPHYRRGIHPYSIIRREGWKLIKYYSGETKYELYNLNQDPGEENNLALAQKTRVKKMDHELQEILLSMNAIIPKKAVK